ncbi:HAMP domain-containing sensor histidine kinase [Streptomyces sp. NPDC051219]|uniref:sensor histidine kinase n=1 Tax=Streptomyces sp. NPDC051219 TaxID=3155283 RepID=UPI003439B49F
MRRRHRGPASLRFKLTVTNVVLLAVAVSVAICVSLVGMRHYLLSAVDTELLTSREGLQQAGLDLKEIESLSALASVRDRLAPDRGGASTLPSPETVFVAVGDGGGAMDLAGFAPSERQRALARSVEDPAALAASAEAHDIRLRGDSYRAVGATLDDGTTVLMATSTEAVHASLRKALRLDVTFGVVLLGLLGVMTMIGAQHRLRPLEDMVETASAIADGDLTRRVPPSRRTAAEVDQLRVALNTMLQQVESAYVTRERSAAQLRRFVADASHELRTPLSAIRGYLQLADKGMLRDPAERARAQRRMNAETDRMSRLVDELLILARLDQRPELRLREVDLSRLVRDAAEDLRAQQPERPVGVSADGVMVVRADEAGLRQVLGNLLGNIRVHTPAGAAVRVELSRTGTRVRLRVADEGPGLCEEDAARIFDRFFRTGGAAGSGLGLAIVQGVVEAHGGGVAVETAPGKGLAVTVSLPSG